MGKNLYVGNLSYDVNDTSLEGMFSSHGTVESAKVIMDRDSGRSKGFGFVEMSSDEEAQAAIAALDGQDCGGRNIKVNEAKPRENSGGGACASRSIGGCGSRTPSSRRAVQRLRSVRTAQSWPVATTRPATRFGSPRASNWPRSPRSLATSWYARKRPPPWWPTPRANCFPAPQSRVRKRNSESPRVPLSVALLLPWV